MNVLISGAGIAGEVAAFWLAKTGAQVTVLEKTKELLPHGQNIDFSDGAISIIKKMGLMDEVQRYNTTETGTQFELSNGTVYADMPLNRGKPHFSPTNENEILRGDLAKVLHGSTKSLPNVKHLFGTTVSRVVENNEKHVKVELSNGDVVSSDALVIADGQWSRTRKMCFGENAVKLRDFGAFIAWFTIPKIASDNKKWRIYIAGNARVLGNRPDPHGNARISLSYLPRNEAEITKWQEAARGSREMQNDLVTRTFSDAGWEAKRFVKELPHSNDFYFQSVSQIQMDKWSTGRVVVIGDSAYCPTPFAGGGCTLAILGAYYLAGELSTLAKNEHPARAFDAFEQKMRPIATEVQSVPLRGPRILHPDTWYKAVAVQSLVATVALLFKGVLAIPPLARRLYYGLGGEDHSGGTALPPYAMFDGDQKTAP